MEGGAAKIRSRVKKMAEMAETGKHEFLYITIIYFMIVRLDDLQLFINGVRSVTLDDGFNLATENAQRARHTAELKATTIF